MEFVAAAAIAWIALFAALQWAMKHDAEHAEAFAQPIDKVRTIEEVLAMESHGQSKDRKVG